MKRFWLISLIWCAGCAGSIFSHKVYNLRQGQVAEASPALVRTTWPKDDWYYHGDGSEVVGDSVANVCPADVPAKGTRFNGAKVTWDKGQHCWHFQVTK